MTYLKLLIRIIKLNCIALDRKYVTYKMVPCAQGSTIYYPSLLLQRSLNLMRCMHAYTVIFKLTASAV